MLLGSLANVFISLERVLGSLESVHLTPSVCGGKPADVKIGCDRLAPKGGAWNATCEDHSGFLLKAMLRLREIPTGMQMCTYADACCT